MSQGFLIKLHGRFGPMPSLNAANDSHSQVISNCPLTFLQMIIIRKIVAGQIISGEVLNWLFRVAQKRDLGIGAGGH
ncbi:MAG: hypothetical protein CMM48_01920 [Rhodospirillaceae bacterium]|nr:hypothetical protein [Rhodospirillaceae bacterium]